MKAGRFVFLFYLFISVCNSFAGQIVKTCPVGYVGGVQYEINDNNLTYANPDLYLESTGTQYIDTGFVPTENTRVVATVSMTNNTGYNWMFGVIAKSTLGKQSCYGLAIHNRRFYSEIPGVNTYYGYTLLYDSPYKIEFTVSDVLINGVSYDTKATKLLQTDLSMYLFANNISGTTYDQRFVGRIYDFKIYESDELVRHFVPVQSGLEIGDYVVPENGMWEIVEQKFYGNIGTGEFLFNDTMCKLCPSDKYYTESDGVEKCADCPVGYTDDKMSGKKDISECKKYCIGGYVAQPYDSDCTDAGVGFYSERKYVAYGETSMPEKCPDGMTSAGVGALADERDDCGRILWVNNVPIYARNVKKTMPSLNIKVADTVYYVNMTPSSSFLLKKQDDTKNKLYIKYNDEQYLAHDDSLFRYDIVDANANTNSFLESTGTQYIDIEYVPTEKTRIETTVMDLGQDTVYRWIFGNINRTIGKTTCFGLGTYQNHWYSEISGGNTNIAQMEKWVKYSVIFTVPQLYYNDYWYNTGGDYARYTAINYPIFMFANNNAGKIYDQRFVGRIYDFKIYESDELVRHFIPVPRGLLIGDAVIPENGMWELVKQKFYGNVGTGEFVYGADE